jgi:hypothetical protein
MQDKLPKTRLTRILLASTLGKLQIVPRPRTLDSRMLVLNILLLSYRMFVPIRLHPYGKTGSMSVSFVYGNLQVRRLWVAIRMLTKENDKKQNELNYMPIGWRQLILTGTPGGVGRGMACNTVTQGHILLHHMVPG